LQNQPRLFGCVNHLKSDSGFPQDAVAQNITVDGLAHGARGHRSIQFRVITLEHGAEVSKGLYSAANCAWRQATPRENVVA
jgi:hypothetical protein